MRRCCWTRSASISIHRRRCTGSASPTRHVIPIKPDSIPEQLSQIEDIIVKTPSAIVFIPVDDKAMVPGIKTINDAGISMVDVTDRSAGGKFSAFVGADDYSLGLETARNLLKSIGGKDKIVIIESVKGSLTNVVRVRGFNDALTETPGARLVASQPANYQRLQALQVMENLMQANSEIDGVLAANDAMAAGAIEALDGANARRRWSGSTAPRRPSTRSRAANCWPAATITASCRVALIR